MNERREWILNSGHNLHQFYDPSPRVVITDANGRVLLDSAKHNPVTPRDAFFRVLRLKEQWDAHPDSTVTVLCACGASFSEHGPSDDVQQKARAFLRSHNCPIGTIEGDVILYNVQRTGDETL